MTAKKKKKAIDKAFTNSDKHTLDDLKLFPWTPDRIIAAQLLGMIYPNIGKEGWAQWKRTGVYPGAMKDVMIFVYLSTLDGDELEEATFQAAKTFGVTRNLHLASGDAFWEAFAKFVEVEKEIERSATKPKDDDSGEDDDDPKE